MTEETAFGIDFGTTNTRIAYYDGQKLLLVPYYTPQGRHTQIPSLVRFIGGTVSSFGHDARVSPEGAFPPGPIKWLLDDDSDFDLDGFRLTSVEIVAEFFKCLKDVVRKSGIREPLDAAAFTVPVVFPARARENLKRACEMAGIRMRQVFPEPVAALYGELCSRGTRGMVAVCDWGGGTLDVAAVRIQAGVALVKNQGGFARGGDEFDGMLVDYALEGFVRDHPACQFTPIDICQDPRRGPELRLHAETAKIQLSAEPRAYVTHGDLLPGMDLDCEVRVEQFEEWLRPHVDRAISTVRRVVGQTKTSPSRLLLSGGTCNIPCVRTRFEAEFGPDLVIFDFAVPYEMQMDSRGMADVGNATALGAALLAIHGAEPVFARDLGVRLAGNADDGDGFYTVFRAGSPVRGQKITVPFFVTSAENGVARVLVADRLDPVFHPRGRLLRVIPIPIDRNEMWVDVHFAVDSLGTLRVEGSGRIARVESRGDGDAIHGVNLGYRLPSYRRPPEVPVDAI